LLLAWRGHWQAADQTLAAGQGLCWADTTMEWPLQSAQADAALLAVRWNPTTP